MSNREIKFRVWDKVDYMTTFTLSDLQERKIEFTDDCPVVQYTGLKDKNGKEIYEGDIVSNELVDGVVVFDSGAFSLEVTIINSKNAGYDFGSTPCLCDFAENEVIGNTFENINNISSQ